MNLTKIDWPLGWTPSADQTNGDPRGLLRMDNLCLDEQGVLSLIQGFKKINPLPLPNWASKVYSKEINGKEAIWVAVGGTSNQIFRSAKGDFTDILLTAFGSAPAYFGDALGYVLIIAGDGRWKDNGSGAGSIQLGLSTPNKPDIKVKTQQVIEFGTDALPTNYDVVTTVSFTPLIAIIGGITYGTINSSTSSSVNATTESTTTSCIIESKNAVTDLININGQASSDPSKDNIQIKFTPSGGAAITSLLLAFVLDKTPFNDPNASYSDAYVYGWGNVTVASDGVTGGNLNTTFPTGQTQTFNVPRGQFLRVGNDTSLDWTKVSGVYLAVQASADSTFDVGPIIIYGGALGQLNGIYQWVQVNIGDNGIYQAKSPVSPPTDPISVSNGTVTLTPTNNGDPNVTDVWFFRISVTPTDGTQDQSFLNQYYLTAKTKPGVAVDDSTADVDAIETNVIANLFLRTLIFNDLTNGVPDVIIGMEGLFFERMFYLTTTQLLVSDALNPDAIDSRYSIKPSGDPTEVNLWIKRLNNSVMILATSKNLYEITGTLATLPDGTLDIAVIPIGEQYPPLSNDCWGVNGGIYYVASDGYRVTTGSNSQNISPQLRLLFQGQDRYGVPAVFIDPDNIVGYPLAVGHNKLYSRVPLVDGTARMIVYDFILQSFHLVFAEPTAIWVTQTDKVLLGGANFQGGSFSGDIYQAESGSGFTDSTGALLSGLSATLQTVFDANGQPRNRKDTFTLKIVCDTNGDKISVSIAKDSQVYVPLGQFSANGTTTIYIPLNNVTLGFRYSILIQDTNLLTKFKLYELTIEYEPRPEQVDYLRILPTNLGTISRKRFTSFAFVIDTLGNSIQFVPYVDNNPQPSDNVNTLTKLTHLSYFTSETIGTDIGGILSGGVFEFYGVNLEETVSEKLPTPVKFLVIPANNYGTPDRKRHTSYKFQINTRGARVQFTPILDGAALQPATYSTPTKQTVEYFFNNTDIIAIDIGGTLRTLDDTPFEFYGVIVPEEVEKLPPRLTYFVIPLNDYGSPNRKRFSSVKFQINTNGQDVIYTPQVDYTTLTPQIVNTPYKKTVFIYFNFDLSGVDIGGTLASVGATPFEFYGLVVPQEVEEIPPLLEYFLIPPNNYGTPNRKRMSSFKFQINTFGQNVTFVPLVDGASGPPLTFHTDRKATVEYFYEQDTVGIDFNGSLISDAANPFEFYEVVVPQQIEVLPPRLEFYKPPNTNFEVAAKKRIRTLPIVIDTYGQNVIFTPSVDGVLQSSTTTLNTTGKTTTYHFFSSDVFGTDFGGTFQNTSGPFEFYGFGTPEDVEILPVPKLFDQLGPTRFDKIGKIFGFRIRLIMNGSTTILPFSVFGDDSTTNPSNQTPLYSNSFTVRPGIDNVYEIFFPKNVNTDIFRLVIGPTLDTFHRYDAYIKVQTSGMESDSKWIPIR